MFTTSTEPDGDREEPMAGLVAFSGTCPDLITFAELMELREQDLPDSLDGKLREFAEAEGLPVEQLVASAAAEKLAALLDGAAYLRREAAFASQGDFERIIRPRWLVWPNDARRLPACRSGGPLFPTGAR